MSEKKKTTNWSDPEVQRKLTLAVLASNDDLKFSPSLIAGFMGNDITAKAITHQLPKLKADIETVRNHEELAPLASAAPLKRKLKTTDAPVAAQTDEEVKENEDVEPTPSKKVKITKSKSKSKKVEEASPTEKVVEQVAKEATDVDDAAEEA